MTWISLGQFEVQQDWQSTATVQSEIFRISHRFDQNVSIRGVIAQGFEDEKVNIFSPRLFSYRNENEIFSFYFPSGMDEHSLYFRQLNSSVEGWFIEVEAFQGSPDDDLLNYLATRFGPNVTALYQTIKSGSVAASSISANINSSPFLYSNPNRKGATIWNNSTSNLFIDFDTEATTTEYAVKIPSHGYFELPFNYVGPIAGVWEVADGQAFIREFN